jgi:sulfoxide reductase heme-binding subunit YedZ
MRCGSRLHRLIYAAALLGVVHFVWRVKVDLRKPLVFAAVVALLLGARGVALVLRHRRHGPG